MARIASVGVVGIGAVVMCAMGGCGGGAGSAGSSPPATQGAIDPTDPNAAKVAELMVADTQPALKTEDFDEGRVHLDTVAPERLMTLLRDLKERREYDLSQHDGKPGPDGGFLDERIRQIGKELQRRGYPVDEEGAVQRGG